MYSPTLGRWMQQDPAGYVDGMNPYQFVDDVPVALNDPSGLDAAPENPQLTELHFGNKTHALAGWLYGVQYTFENVDSTYELVQSVEGTISAFGKNGRKLGTDTISVHEFLPITKQTVDGQDYWVATDLIDFNETALTTAKKAEDFAGPNMCVSVHSSIKFHAQLFKGATLAVGTDAQHTKPYQFNPATMTAGDHRYFSQSFVDFDKDGTTVAKKFAPDVTAAPITLSGRRIGSLYGVGGIGQGLLTIDHTDNLTASINMGKGTPESGSIVWALDPDNQQLSKGAQQSFPPK